MMLEKALDFLFPPVCGICLKKSKDWICNDCLKSLNPYLRIIKNKKSKINYKIYYLFEYKDIIRKKLIEFKYNDKSYLYRTFSNIILKNKKLCKILNTYDIIIPVPMNKSKKAQRGYNQTELISNLISEKLKINVNNKVLLKTRDNKTQSLLDYKQRKENVKNTYKIDEKYLKNIKDKKVLLLDDIYTTGFTANACIEEIIKLNPSKVDVLVISKGKIEGW